jgi:histidinol-phosphate/aromatic aminotransferase/cobyric acid decarboxylase-like protein
MPPWPVGLPSQAAAMEALRDSGYYSARYAETAALRSHCLKELAGSAVATESNFYLVRMKEPGRVAARLRQDSIFVREFDDGPLAGGYLRFAVKSAEQNARILAAARAAQESDS